MKLCKVLLRHTHFYTQTNSLHNHVAYSLSLNLSLYVVGTKVSFPVIPDILTF